MTQTTFPLNGVYDAGGNLIGISPNGQPAIPVAALDIQGNLLTATGAPLFNTSKTPSMIANGQALALHFNFQDMQMRERLVDKQTRISLTKQGGTPPVVTTQATVTINTSGTALVTEPAPHLLKTGDVVRLRANATTGTPTLPTGLVNGRPYQASVVSTTTYNLMEIGDTALVAVSAVGNNTSIERFSGNKAEAANVRFTASGFLSADITNWTWLQRNLFRLDTLTNDEMIVIYLRLKQMSIGQASNDGTIFSWGRRATGTGANNGYALQLVQSLATTKFQFAHNGASGGFEKQAIDAAFAAEGSDYSLDNVLCFTITKMRGDNNRSGRGWGMLEIQMARAGLSNEGNFGGGKNYYISTPWFVPIGASGPSSTCADTGLTIGAWPTTTATTAVEPLAATVGMDFIGFQRRPRQSGLCCTVVRELRDLWQSAPHAPMPVPPCLSTQTL